MRAPNDAGLIRLEGTLESALAARKALIVARDLMPQGEDRDEITGLIAHLRYAITDKGYAFIGENEIFGSKN